jgi:hypothetical protein
VHPGDSPPVRTICQEEANAETRAWNMVNDLLTAGVIGSSISHPQLP